MKVLNAIVAISTLIASLLFATPALAENTRQLSGDACDYQLVDEGDHYSLYWGLSDPDGNPLTNHLIAIDHQGSINGFAIYGGDNYTYNDTSHAHWDEFVGSGITLGTIYRYRFTSTSTPNISGVLWNYDADYSGGFGRPLGLECNESTTLSTAFAGPPAPTPTPTPIAPTQNVTGTLSLSATLSGLESLVSGQTASSLLGIVLGTSLIGGLLLGVVTRIKSF